MLNGKAFLLFTAGIVNLVRPSNGDKRPVSEAFGPDASIADCLENSFVFGST